MYAHVGAGSSIVPTNELDSVFFEAPSRILARRSGSSGVSRYFSAADDSDFEDADSDWAEGGWSLGSFAFDGS
jgi:hypothetical protein